MLVAPFIICAAINKEQIILSLILFLLLDYVRVNEELTKFHSEVLSNLNCVHGALLRMNRSIQAEGAFGGIKWNKGYKRLRRRGIEGVILELGLISCGFNLYKYHLRKLAAQKAA